jgi:putative peptidoglycan lipid II flippase
MVPLRHVGIALASALAAWLNVALLALVLRRRGQLVLDARLKARVPRILAACLALGLALAGGARLLVPAGGSWAGFADALRLAVLVGGGGALFGVLVWAFGAFRPADLKSMRRGGRGAA